MKENAISPLRPRRGYQKLWGLLLLCLAMLNVTACDYVSKKFYPDFKHTAEKTPVEKPPFARKDISIEKVRDIAKNTKTDDNDFTINPVLTVSQKNPLSHLPEPTTDQTNLFAVAAKSEEERFQRIENKIQRLSDTLSRMSPAITRLMDVDSELDALTFQLEELINKGQMNAMVQGANAPIMAQHIVQKPKAITPPLPEIKEAMAETTSHTLQQEIAPAQIAPAAGNAQQQAIPSNNLIHKIRLADHANKTRIVFETEEKLDYSINIDSANKIMTISFPEGQISSDPASRARFSNLIQDIAQRKKSNGADFSFKLSHAPKTSKDFRMSPDEDVSRQRVVIDLIH